MSPAFLAAGEGTALEINRTTPGDQQGPGQGAARAHFADRTEPVEGPSYGGRESGDPERARARAVAENVPGRRLQTAVPRRPRRLSSTSPQPSAALPHAPRCGLRLGANEHPSVLGLARRAAGAATSLRPLGLRPPQARRPSRRPHHGLGRYCPTTAELPPSPPVRNTDRPTAAASAASGARTITGDRLAPPQSMAVRLAGLNPSGRPIARLLLDRPRPPAPPL